MEGCSNGLTCCLDLCICHRVRRIYMRRSSRHPTFCETAVRQTFWFLVIAWVISIVCMAGRHIGRLLAPSSTEERARTAPSRHLPSC